MCGLSVIALDETHERDCLVGAGSRAIRQLKKELLLRGGLITSCGADETESAGRASGSAGAAHRRKVARTRVARGVMAVSATS